MEIFVNTPADSRTQFSPGGVKQLWNNETESGSKCMKILTGCSKISCEVEVSVKQAARRR